LETEKKVNVEEICEKTPGDHVAISALATVAYIAAAATWLYMNITPPKVKVVDTDIWKF